MLFIFVLFEKEIPVETIITGVMDDELMNTLQKAAELFKGRQVKVVFLEQNGDNRKPRGKRE